MKLENFVELLLAIIVAIFIAIIMIIPRLDAPLECWSSQDPQLCKIILAR